ncbi:chaperone modulator CbpM [Arenicella xantha]|uniref:MerR family transcriptional regulator n=1 Tax=Arenicella xantha TaxID=644221 RepID=A0A395JKG0_9GAMM|nr:chaperone modulator CbpM [Arenicella xantha]RBP51242.1 MerR family transcriptional regulator [Arenicella xantha]
MTNVTKDSLSGIVLTKHISFTTNEFCRACGADQTIVIRMVEEGVIEAAGPAPDWEFHGEALVRAQRAMRLIEDLGVNLAGAALALDLLDRMEELEATALRVESGL